MCWLSVPHGESLVVSTQQTPEGVVSDSKGELIGSPCGTARVRHELTFKREGANTQVPEDLSQNGDGVAAERERERERERGICYSTFQRGDGVAG